MQYKAWNVTGKEGLMAEKIFAARKIVKQYKKTNVLNNFDMEIYRGDIYGFAGRNGSGKTTLMRILTGMVRQTEGEIEIFGEKNPAKLHIQRKNIGALVEKPAFYSGMTARDNLEVIRLQCGIKEKNCINQLLEITGLEDTGSKKAGNFSLGMKQKLGIAIALMGRPRLLVLDEPVNGLYPEEIFQLRELLKKLNKEHGITILISSHILSELDQLATCYGFISRGRMLEQISSEELMIKCQPCLSIRTENVQNTALVLKRMFPDKEFVIVSDSRVNLYGFTGSTKEVVKELVLNETGVKEIRAEGASLEKYYMSLMDKESNV